MAIDSTVTAIIASGIDALNKLSDSDLAEYLRTADSRLVATLRNVMARADRIKRR